MVSAAISETSFAVSSSSLATPSGQGRSSVEPGSPGPTPYARRPNPTGRRSVGTQAIDVVRKNLALTGVDELDAAVIRFGRQLFHDNKMDSATFAKAVQLFGKKGAMDLVAVMSTYAVSGFYATAVDEHMPAGRPDLESPARP